jgi:D-amino peptidase
MRIYVSADIEGLCGVTTTEQTRVGGFEYEQARSWMTGSVVAVCEAAHQAGATELVVSDSHGNGQNIHVDRLPSYVQLVRAWPRPLGMMQGIECGSYAGAMLVGYHAGSTNPAGILAHTMSGEFFQEIRLNGEVASEAVLSAAIAGHFDVPILLFAGDDVSVTETRELLGDVTSATLKSGFGFFSSLTPSPAEGERRLREATREAIAQMATRKPYRMEGEVELQLRLRTRFVAEWLSYLDAVERVDAFTVRYRGASIVHVSKFLMFILSARTAVT